MNELSHFSFIKSADPSGSGLIYPGALAEWSKALDLNFNFSNLISSEACVRTTWASIFPFAFDSKGCVVTFACLVP